MAAEGNGDLPVPDLRNIEELCQLSLNGRGGPIAPIAIQATVFGLKNDMIQQPLLATLKTYMLQEPIKFIKMNTASSSGLETLPGNTITNPKEDLKGITTRSGTAYPGPTNPTTSSSPIEERETEVTKDTVNPTKNRSTKDVQPPVVPIESLILNFEPVISPIIEPIASPVSAPRPNQRPSIPYPSRLQDQKLRDKANDQREKFFQIFKDLNFNINFSDAFILMPKFGPSIKSLLTSKDKLCELARTLLNEHCLAVLLKKLPEILGDPGKFLIPCDFPRMAKCLALADLSASINLMPLFVWNKLSFLDLSPMCMTLELANRLISRSVGVAEDVFVKVGTFHFLADFVVIDFDADPRVPLILRRSFLKIGRALIDVFEEYSQEVLGFSNVIMSGNPTPYYDSIVSNTSSTLTPFGESDFLLEEVDAVLALEDDLTSPKVDQYYVKLKDLPPHLEYAFLEGDDKLPVIIAKYLSVGEKTALITVLKSHKRAIAWKLSDIKCIDLNFGLTKFSWSKTSYQRPWVSPVHCVPKKGGFTVVKNEENELVLTRLVTGWHVCIDYRKWNEATRKDHFPLHFMDQMLQRLAGNQYYCFHDGFFGYFQIPIDPKDQEKTTFTCPYRTFAYRRMPFRPCNAPDTNLCLNWEKSHFMVKEGIVLGYKISKEGIKVDKAKVDVIFKLPRPTTVNECVEAFQTLKRKLTKAPILIALDWDMSFELMCDASDFAIDAVLGQRQEKHFRPIHYASKTMTEAESNYITTEKEMLAVVYAFEKFRSYLIMNKSIVYTDHSTLKYLFAKKDTKARLLRWVLLLQEFTLKVIDTKGAENLATKQKHCVYGPFHPQISLC
uniref:RNA-directed DNA polymerase n=1 Tax=Tanacetum cinerariifolium TaxID=118510 RepID=A0A6L2MKY7_TANCI|nr:hypothetical protein [Tanacetum cinerariifolium]